MVRVWPGLRWDFRLKTNCELLLYSSVQKSFVSRDASFFILWDKKNHQHGELERYEWHCASCFKTSPCGKLSLIWKWVLFAWKWTSRWNSFPYEWYRMKTQIDRGKSQLSWSDLLWEGCIFLEPAILMTIFCWYCKEHELKWFSLQMACYFNFCIVS